MTSSHSSLARWRTDAGQGGGNDLIVSFFFQLDINRGDTWDAGFDTRVELAQH
jgi:hypothetical protein